MDNKIERMIEKSRRDARITIPAKKVSRLMAMARGDPR